MGLLFNYITNVNIFQIFYHILQLNNNNNNNNKDYDFYFLIFTDQFNLFNNILIICNKCGSIPLALLYYSCI